MRKLLLILSLFFFIHSFGQNPTGPTPPLPNWNWIGSPTTLSETKGVHRFTYGHILSRWADTTTANTNAYIKSYAGLMIIVGDTVFVRNSTATAWITISGGGGGGSGTVTSFSSGDLAPLFTTVVTDPTTTPALSFTLNTQQANMVFAGPATGADATPTFRALVAADISGLVTASQGLTISGLDVQLFGPLATPALLSTERSINLGRQILHFNNSENQTTSGGPVWQHSNRPFSPYQFISTDTLVANTIDPPTAAMPVSGIFARRTVFYNSGIFTTQKIYGHYIGMTYNWLDSMRFRTEGGDYNQAVIAELRLQPRGTGPQRVGHNGAISNTLPYYSESALVGNIILENSGGLFDGSTSTIHTYGWLNPVKAYLVTGSLDTVERASFFQTGNFLGGKTGKLYGMDFQHNLEGAGGVDSSFGIWDQYGYRHYLRGKTVFGAAAGTNNWTSSDQVKVIGNVNITDSLILGKASLIGDTTGMDLAIRRRTDGTIFRMRPDLLVTALGIGASFYTTNSSFTSNRTATLAGNSVTFVEGAETLLQLDPVALTTLIASNDGGGTISALRLRSDGGSGDIDFLLQTTNGVNTAYISGDAQDNAIDYIAGTHNITGALGQAGGDVQIMGNVAIGAPPGGGSILLVNGGSGVEQLNINTTSGSELSTLLAVNFTGGDNYAFYEATTTNTQAKTTLSATFNASAEQAIIEQIAQSGSSIINYTADDHIINGVVTLASLAGNGSGIVAVDNSGTLSWLATPGGVGTVTSVSFTGGIISVATATSTPALTVAGTSGGVVYFSSTSTWASSGLLTASAIVLGGGAGAAPTTLALGTANQVLGMNNAATAHEYKTQVIGTAGTDVAIVHTANTITLNVPDASATARGVMTTGTQTIAGDKTLSGTTTIATPFTLGATSVTTTGTQLNYLSAATGTTGTASTNIVFSAGPTLTGTTTMSIIAASGFSTFTAGFSTGAVAGNSNLYVTGGITANRNTTASLLPLSASGVAARAFINGTTAYTITANDAFTTLTIGHTGGVTEAASGTHPIIASLSVLPITVTNAAGATDILAGVYIEGPATGVTPVTASYGLWLDAGDARFDGNVGIGVTATTARLHLAAGTTAASTAPLKFTSGSLNTTAEAGAVEFLTDAFYGTITTGAARKTFAFLESPTFTGTAIFAAIRTPSFQTATVTSGSNLYINSSDGIFIAQNNSQLLFGGASTVGYRMIERGAFNTTLGVGDALGSHIIGTQQFTEAASGTHALVSQLVVNPLTGTGGAAATTDAATVFINGAMTGVTPTGRNDALRVSGTTVFLGDVTNSGSRTLMNQGTDVASAAGAITLAADGNAFEITGTSAITLISNVGWQNGSIVRLIFTSTASVASGTATSGNNITVLLSGAATFNGTADDVLTLILSEVGGTQAWREVGRSVN